MFKVLIPLRATLHMYNPQIQLLHPCFQLLHHIKGLGQMAGQVHSWGITMTTVPSTPGHPKTWTAPQDLQSPPPVLHLVPNPAPRALSFLPTTCPSPGP